MQGSKVKSYMCFPYVGREKFTARIGGQTSENLRMFLLGTWLLDDPSVFATGFSIDSLWAPEMATRFQSYPPVDMKSLLPERQPQAHVWPLGACALRVVLPLLPPQPSLFFFFFF